jgi:hypothetical protein
LEVTSDRQTGDDSGEFNISSRSFINGYWRIDRDHLQSPSREDSRDSLRSSLGR